MGGCSATRRGGSQAAVPTGALSIPLATSGQGCCPFPYPDPDRLVFIWDSNPGRGWGQFSVSPPNFIDYREQIE